MRDTDIYEVVVQDIIDVVEKHKLTYVEAYGVLESAKAAFIASQSMVE